MKKRNYSNSAFMDEYALQPLNAYIQRHYIICVSNIDYVLTGRNSYI